MIRSNYLIKIYLYFTEQWPFGRVFCYITSAFQGITILVSSYTLVIISIERYANDILVIGISIQSAICTIFRYMTILHPLRTVIRREYGRWIIIGLWILCTLASIPNIIHTKHFQHSYNGKDIWICHSGKII